MSRKYAKAPGSNRKDVKPRLVAKLGEKRQLKRGADPWKLRECLPADLFLHSRLKKALTRDEVKKFLKDRLVKIDGIVRTDPNFPVGLMDVVTIEKTDDYFRFMYDSHGRIIAHRITPEESKIKICKVMSVEEDRKGNKFLHTHDCRTLRDPDPAIKVNDSVQIDVFSSKIQDHIRFEPGAHCIITGGSSLGKSGVVQKSEKAVSSVLSEIVHIQDTKEDAFATNIKHVMLVGKSDCPLVSIPSSKKKKLS